MLVEKVFLSDPAQTLFDGKMKNQLRLAFVEYLPKKVLERRSKFGYTTPETAWLKSIGLQDSKSKASIGSHAWRKYIISKWIIMIENNE